MELVKILSPFTKLQSFELHVNTFKSGITYFVLMEFQKWIPMLESIDNDLDVAIVPSCTCVLLNNEHGALKMIWFIRECSAKIYDFDPRGNKLKFGTRISALMLANTGYMEVYSFGTSLVLNYDENRKLLWSVKCLYFGFQPLVFDPDIILKEEWESEIGIPSIACGSATHVFPS